MIPFVVLLCRRLLHVPAERVAEPATVMVADERLWHIRETGGGALLVGAPTEILLLAAERDVLIEAAERME